MIRRALRVWRLRIVIYKINGNLRVIASKPEKRMQVLSKIVCQHALNYDSILAFRVATSQSQVVLAKSRLQKQLLCWLQFLKFSQYSRQCQNLFSCIAELHAYVVRSQQVR
ncbi:MAG: hypothetical protein EZS28_028205 [Streblomastix strix]|uniref:Uncharacterized protein n=1 Tax=Streblomastix strix TaxID=222440 RepID=A0A5J4V0L6_9EUKA|nr:MAG: hypothetical protein EZS28_028205 [Streblomastix strix]